MRNYHLSRFAPKSSVCYCDVLISFFLFETYKKDVLEEVILIGNYDMIVRRKALDFATKVISAEGQIDLMVTKAVMDNLRFVVSKSNPYTNNCLNTIIFKRKRT